MQRPLATTRSAPTTTASMPPPPPGAMRYDTMESVTCTPRRHEESSILSIHPAHVPPMRHRVPPSHDKDASPPFPPPHSTPEAAIHHGVLQWHFLARRLGFGAFLLSGLLKI